MYLEDFVAAGSESFVSRRRTVTEADCVLFTSLTGITDPVFTDEIFAREQLFSGRVVPGPMIMAYAMGLTDDISYGSVVAALGISNARFDAPVRPGDTIYVVTKVGSARSSSSRPGTGVVMLQHSVINQGGEQVQRFERTLLVLSRPDGDLASATAHDTASGEPGTVLDALGPEPLIP